MVDRDKFQMRYYDKLITNMQHIPSKGFTFDINIHDEIFTFQRLPFYHPVVLDHYHYIIGLLIQKYASQSQSKGKAVSVHEHNPNTALINVKYTLCSLQTNHATFCNVKMISGKLKKNKPGKTYITFCINFYDNKSNLKLLCYMEVTLVYLTDAAYESVKSKREQIKEITSSKKPISVKDFQFIDQPSTVGQLTQKGVFLSNLSYVKHTCTDTIYCNGFINFENGFDKHPYIGGSGDHINSNHASDVCLQFIYLLVRKSKMNPFKQSLSLMDKRFSELIDAKSCLAIFNADLQFKRFMELGQFRIKLIDVKIQICQDCDENCFVCKMKLPYSFKVELCMEQRNKICVQAKLNCCPLFLSSQL